MIFKHTKMTQLSKFYHCIFCRKASMFGLFQKRVQASLYYSVRKLPTFLIESTQSVYHAPGLWWHPVRRNSPSLNDPFYLVKEQVLNYSITKSHSFQISIHWRCERSMVRESHSAGWREYLPTWKKSKDYHQSKSTIHRISQLKNISTCSYFWMVHGYIFTKHDGSLPLKNSLKFAQVYVVHCRGEPMKNFITTNWMPTCPFRQNPLQPFGLHVHRESRVTFQPDFTKNWI